MASGEHGRPRTTGTPLLPGDSHVHSEWSWDALAGSMRRTCARAVELGLPVIAFTEHADFTPWTMDLAGRDPGEFPAQWAEHYADGVFTPPDLDVRGYRDCLDSCREAFPQLRILSGVELSEPHWRPDRSRSLLAAEPFDRVLASLHARPEGNGYRLIDDSAYAERSGESLLHWYLGEVERLAEEFDDFEVLAHIDFPLRHWPSASGPFEPERFEQPFRAALAALARTDRILEINTTVPLPPLVVRWWRQEGGRGITFGSDAHTPDDLGRGFREAVGVAESTGFRPGRSPHDIWVRD